jgi:hypothetical protein
MLSVIWFLLSVPRRRDARVMRLRWLDMLVLVSFAALHAGCDGSGAAFERACRGIRRGTPLEDADAVMDAVGARRSFVGEAWMWRREGLLRTDVCEVVSERGDRVLELVCRSE